MKNLLHFILTICIYTTTYCQIGIGTSTPEGALDIVSSDGGVLFPRVNLSELNIQLPVTNPQGGNLAEGTIVWNTTLNSSKSLSPGLYYWANSKWNKVAIESNNFAFDKSTLQIPYITGNECGPLTTLVNNSNIYQSEDNIVAIDLPINNITGVICNINIQIQLFHKFFYQTSMYLMAPNGKVLKLTTGNGNLLGGPGVSGNTYNITFTDQAAINITDYNDRCGGCLTGSYQPEGTLDNYIQSIYDFMPASVSSFSSFHDDNPNGVWKLFVKDIHLGDRLTIQNIKLNISTYGGQMPNDFVLLSEKQINTAESNYIVANATYNANATSNVIQTVITRTTAPVNVSTTSSLPGTILSGGTNSTYNSVRWTAVSNNDISSGLTPNTIYYYQLWRKAAVIAPANQNENFTFILRTEY
nr:hypothetical protein [uncultured Flavobacterium sp.]